MGSPGPREEFSSLDFVVTDTPTAMRVRIGGEVDLANRAALLAALSSIDVDGTSAVRVDLRDLAFCDVRGGLSILEFVQRVRDAGRKSSIQGATPAVRKLLALLSDGTDPYVE